MAYFQISPTGDRLSLAKLRYIRMYCKCKILKEEIVSIAKGNKDKDTIVISVHCHSYILALVMVYSPSEKYWLIKWELWSLDIYSYLKGNKSHSKISRKYVLISVWIFWQNRSDFMTAGCQREFVGGWGRSNHRNPLLSGSVALQDH